MVQPGPRRQMLPGAILANPLDTGAMPWKIHISSFIDANHLPRRTLPPDEPEISTGVHRGKNVTQRRKGAEQAGFNAYCLFTPPRLRVRQSLALFAELKSNGSNREVIFGRFPGGQRRAIKWVWR